MNEICIYCMGDYGLETYFKLKEMGVSVRWFGDRDTSKHGYALEGISCISYEDVLKLDKKNSVIVVAVKNSYALIEQFKEYGFENIYNKDEIVSVIETRKIKKQYISLTDICKVEEYKECLAKAYYEKEYKDKVDNVDIQQIIVDLSKRRKKS